MTRKRARLVALALLLILGLVTIPVGSLLDSPPDLRVTWSAQVDNMPSIAKTTTGKMWVFWHSNRAGNFEIFYKIHDPSQTHPWSGENRLTNNSNVDMTPTAIQTNDGKIWVVWATNRTGNYEIFYNVYNGSSWLLTDVQLTTNASRDEFPSVMQAVDGKIWVVWDSSRLGTGYEIFYKTTSNYGATWTPDMPLQFGKVGNWDPSITQAADSKIWLVWTGVDDDVYYSVYNGVSWEAAKTLTSDPLLDYHPSVGKTNDGKIWVVWDSNRVSNQSDVYYKTYSSGSWSGETRVTTTTSDDMAPSIVQDANLVTWIAWGSNRGSNWDIYFRNSMIPPAHDVELFSVTPNTTVATRGSNVSVEVVARNKGSSDENTQVLLYANTSLVGNSSVSVTAGQLYPVNFVWATSGFALGNYVLNATVKPVVGETYVIDNNYVFGVVKVVTAPVADFTYSPPFPLPNDAITFDASASTPDGGFIISYRWDFDDGNVTIVSYPVITHRYLNPDVYTVTLTITDSEGPTDSLSKSISVHRHDVAILWGNAYLDKSAQGVSVPYDVDVTNLGTSQESLEIAVFFNETAVGSTTVPLYPGETLYYVELWADSSLVPPGIYKAKAVAGPLMGETNITDNYWEFGDVWIYVLDLAVTSLVPSVNAAYVGQTVGINIIVKNEGTVDAHADLMLYYNDTLIESWYVYIVADAQSEFYSVWDLLTVTPGFYLLRARVVERESEFMELDLTDNERVHNSVQVKIPGDVNGDKTVSSVDLSLLMSAYGSSAGHSNWNLACDINGDGIVNVSDLFLLGDHFGESNP